MGDAGAARRGGRVLLQVAGFVEAGDVSIAFRANLHDAPSGNFMQWKL